MKTLTTTALFCLILATTLVSLKAAADSPFPGAFMCIHRDLPTPSNFMRHPKIYIYGTVTNPYEVCPVYDAENPANIELTPEDLVGAVWQEPQPPGPQFQSILGIYVQNINFTEHQHGRKTHPDEPSCRFGIMQ